MKIRYLLFLGLTAGYIQLLPAQKKRFGNTEAIVSIHTGPSRMDGNPIGLSLENHPMLNKTWNGWTTTLSIYGFSKGDNRLKLGFGLLYKRSKYSTEALYARDRLTYTVCLPQLACIYRFGKLNAKLSLGLIGAGNYKDEATTFGKEREVYQWVNAQNLLLEGEYCFTRHWGASLKYTYLRNSANKSYSVSYNGEDYSVQNYSETSSYLHHHSLSVGLNFHF